MKKRTSFLYSNAVFRKNQFDAVNGSGTRSEDDFAVFDSLVDNGCPRCS